MMKKGILISAKNTSSMGNSEGIRNFAGAFFSTGHGSTPLSIATVDLPRITFVGTGVTRRVHFPAGPYDVTLLNFIEHYI